MNRTSATPHVRRRRRWQATAAASGSSATSDLLSASGLSKSYWKGGMKIPVLQNVDFSVAAGEFCAIVGLPDEKRPGNDIVKAVVQKTKDVEDQDAAVLEKGILDYCRLNMAPYKVPRLMEFVKEIPLTAVGKVDKKVLR